MAVGHVEDVEDRAVLVLGTCGAMRAAMSVLYNVPVMRGLAV